MKYLMLVLYLAIMIYVINLVHETKYVVLLSALAIVFYLLYCLLDLKDFIKDEIDELKKSN